MSKPRLAAVSSSLLLCALLPGPIEMARYHHNGHAPRVAQGARAAEAAGSRREKAAAGPMLILPVVPQVQVHDDGTTEAWTPRVSLELFQKRKKEGPPLTRRDRHHEIALQRQVLQQFYDDERETRRLKAEAEKRAKPHPLICNAENCIVAGLKVHFEHQKGMFFCRDCPHPAMEGSWMDAWEAHHNPQMYSVGASLVYAVPNDGRSEILNHEDVRGRIALVNRGVVSLNEKVRRAQEAGARGVVILNSPCNRQRDGLRCEAEAKETCVWPWVWTW